jgi:hypothetical protein
MIALYMSIRVVCLHDVSMVVIGVEGAHQEQEEPSHHHVVYRTSLPHEYSQKALKPSVGGGKLIRFISPTRNDSSMATLGRREILSP